MLRNKRILLILIFVLALLLIPSICNAAVIDATQTTQTSNGETVKWSYELDGDTIINLRCTNTTKVYGNVEIPSTIDGYEVVRLGDNSSNKRGIFYDCQGLESVVIPAGVTAIGKGAFEDCISLKRVEIPGSVKIIDTTAFEGCSSLNEITIPYGVIKICERAFADCSALKGVSISESVTTIEKEAFSYCSKLSKLVIPDNVTSLGSGAFEGCTGLKDITLSKNLTELNEQVFHGCSGVTSIVIPDGVTTIAGGTLSYDGAFSGCKGLTKILIPDSVATIEKHAFNGCSNLTIYGHDGQESKRYADEYDFDFNYISNWDKADAGNDVTPPSLESLKIDYSSMFDYDDGTNYYLVSAGTKISIKATFDEPVYGNTVPALTIKCGNGSNIQINNGVIQGKDVIYTYQIKDADKGIISAVSLSGGDIKDEAGNSPKEYTCPKLTTTHIYGENYVFANGTGSVDNGNNGNGGNNGSSTVTLSSIAITKAPTKNTYLEGETFDKTGMVVTATYSDGTTKEVTNYTISPSEALTTDDTKVVILYTENGVTKTVEQKVTVTPKTSSALLTSIKITKVPTKTSYVEGEKFDKTGMVVTATYSDGTTKEITNYTVSPSATLKTTNKKITVAYTENGVTKTVEQTISVKKDSTTKDDSKLPQTGATLLSLVVISLIAVAVVSKVKCEKYKDI